MVNLEDFGFKKEDEDEIERGERFEKTGYPKPNRKFRFIYETFNQSIEEIYFFILRMMQYDLGFGSSIEKLTDSFAASENSAFGGISAQRLSIQQDKVSQFLATVGKMVKELFQVVRELRIIDERLDLYKASMEGKKDAIPAEISLKGYWIDLVEGGAKNPSSVYGMSRELGFATLPDLFFSAPPMDKEKIRDYVEGSEEKKGLEFNRKVREVLMRKLETYQVWKKMTFNELDSRRRFTIKYLKQHFDSINLYMNWVKPYLKAIKRMSMDQGKLSSPHIISTFHTSMVEIELLSYKPVSKGSHNYIAIISSFLYRTMPALSYTDEGYQRGAIHVGNTSMKLMGYIWTKRDIYNYKKMKDQENIELLGTIDSSIQDAMEALGKDLRGYLDEAEGKKEKDAEKDKKKKKDRLANTVFEPVVSVFKGFGELFGAFVEKDSIKEGKCPHCDSKIKPDQEECSICGEYLKKVTPEIKYKWEKEIGKAKGPLDAGIYLLYKAFKQAHGMMAF